MQAWAVEHSVSRAEEAPPTWMLAAACRGHTDLFFAPHYEQASARERREAAARRICGSCPVLDGCRDWAREHREYGVWGAESEEDRAAAGYHVARPVGRLARARRHQRTDRAGSASVDGPPQV